MKVSLEFSKHAEFYDSYNIIQDKVVKKLLSEIEGKPKKILDLGCGSGSVSREIDWKYKKLTAVDFAPRMLEIHPKSKKIECLYGDFNDERLFENLLINKYDHIVSSSALQWAEDLDKVFLGITLLDAPVSFAIFTSGTFKTLNETAKISSLLRSADEVKSLAEKHFNAKFEVVKYALEFASIRDIFKYIKKSGVSGSRNILNYKQMKQLMQDYPHNSLEFEVLFIHSL